MEMWPRRRIHRSMCISSYTKAGSPVLEQALETAALMLGSVRSRGYCLEMICADFLAGANLDNRGDPNVLVRALTTSLNFSPPSMSKCSDSHDWKARGRLGSRRKTNGASQAGTAARWLALPAMRFRKY